MNHWIAPWANSDTLERYDPQDIEKAKALLAEVGWDSGYVRERLPLPAEARPGRPGHPGDVEGRRHQDEVDADPGRRLRQRLLRRHRPQRRGRPGPDFDIGFVYGFGTLDGSPWGSDTTLGSTHVYPQRLQLDALGERRSGTRSSPTRSSSRPRRRRRRIFKRCSEIFNDELPYVAALPARRLRDRERQPARSREGHASSTRQRAASATGSGTWLSA